MIIYAVEYCSCTWESAFETLALYFDIKDAYKHMRDVKVKEYEDLVNSWSHVSRYKGIPRHHRRIDKVPEWIVCRIQKREVI